MSKKRRKNKRNRRSKESESQVEGVNPESEASEGSDSAEMSVIESPTDGFLIDDSVVDDAALEAALDAQLKPKPPVAEETPATEANGDAAEPPAFADAGTEYIEGFLRDELGLDGDLSDDEFALAALDFLGDGPVEGGTVFFNPQELEDLAAQEKLAAAEAVEPSADADAFEQSVAELEEAIAAVADPEFKDEGTVMMSVKAVVPDDVLADAEAALDETIASDAEDSATPEAIAETDAAPETQAEGAAEATETDVEVPTVDAVSELTVEQPETEAVEAVAEVDLSATVDVPETAAEMAVTESSEASVTEIVDTVAELPVEQPDAAIEAETIAEAAVEPAEDSAEIATDATPTISAAEQAELDEAMAELMEIQAMLEADAAGEVIVTDATAEESSEPSETVSEAVAEPTVDEVDETETVAGKSESVDPVASEAIDIPAITESVDAIADEAIAVQAAKDEAEDASAEPIEEDAVAELDSMVIEVEEAPESMMGDAADTTDEPVEADKPLRFDLAALEEEMNADKEAAELASLIDEAGADSMMADLGLDDDLMPDLSAFDESDYLDSIVAALDSEVTEVNLADADSADQQNSIGNNQTEQVIVFSISNSNYAIPIDNVIEIGEPLNETNVPFVPSWVRGVINLRGEIISLVDLRTYFEVDPSEIRPAEWMIVTQTTDASMVVGFIVDDVIGNRQFSRSEISELSSEVDGPSSKYLQHIFRHEDGLVAVLDFDKLLRSSDMRQFEPV